MAYLNTFVLYIASEREAFLYEVQVHLCQDCYIQDRPVVVVCKCEHQVCELCNERGCSQCNEKKFIGIKVSTMYVCVGLLCDM